MCMSKPKIPDNRTPPAPQAPEAAPEFFGLGDNSRYQMLRQKGLTIPVRPDLSGLGNQAQGSPVSRILIRPGENTPVNVNDALAAAQERADVAEVRATQVTAPRYGGHQSRGGSAGRGR